MTFNLIDEPWIPVLHQGKRTSVSVRTALLDGACFAGLAVEYPAHGPALLRQVLLPVLLDAGITATNERQWATRFSQKGWSTEDRELLEEYLDEHHDAFDLFDPERPFAQIGGLTSLTAEANKPVMQMIAYVASGNNVPLFSPYTEGDGLVLSPAQAALWLMHLHCWDTAAIKTGVVGDPAAKAGKTTGNRTGPLGGYGVVIPTGATLRETLLLNLPIRPDGIDREVDRPSWRRELTPVWEPAGEPKGIVELLTWQARRVRLFHRETDDGMVVDRVLIAAGDRIAAVPDYEPHTLWTRRATTRGGPASPVPLRHRVGRAAWRGLETLLAMDLPVDGEGRQTSGLMIQLRTLRGGDQIPATYPAWLEVHGYQYGTQSSTYEEGIFDTLPLPLQALIPGTEAHDAALEIAAQADLLERALNTLFNDLRRAAGGDPVPWDRGERPGSVLINALDEPARDLLTKLRDADIDRAEELMLGWERTAYHAVTHLAESILNGASPETFIGRHIDGRMVRAATAEDGFERRVRDALPRATDVDNKNVLRRRAWRMPRIEQRGPWFWTTYNPSSAASRAQLAVLARATNQEPGDDPALWGIYKVRVPDTAAAYGDVTPAMRAEHIALGLFATHQQSHGTHMHKQKTHLGTALRKLRRDDYAKSPATLDERVNAAATSTSLEELAQHLRGLVNLLSNANIAFDYDWLLADLVDWSDPRTRPRARRRWGATYFVWNAPSQDAGTDQTAN